MRTCSWLLGVAGVVSLLFVTQVVRSGPPNSSSGPIAQFASSFPSGSGPNDSRDSLIRLPVIPERALYAEDRHARESKREGRFQVAGAATSSCPDSILTQLPGESWAVHFDSVRRVTEVYAGDYWNDRILRIDIDSDLNVSTLPLSVTYGAPWIAADLDLDGNIELVLQRGDEGFGGNGWLDILSAPSWTLRSRTLLPGMKVVSNATVVNVDADPYLEIHATPSSLGGTGYAIIIEYVPQTDTFVVISAVATPVHTVGESAIGDFDEDGRIEFISGNDSGYALYEWQDTAIVHIGPVGLPYWGYAAISCRPLPNGHLCALLGNSDFDAGYRYQLIEPNGNNSFIVVHVFQEFTGANGLTPCGSTDWDCDGMDEIAVHVFPNARLWEWDPSSASFLNSCTWPFDSVGTLIRYRGVDLDGDNRREFLALNHLRNLVNPSASSCLGCDSAGVCPSVPPCLCDCYADPECDSIRSNAQDVVSAVNVAFRGIPAVVDALCLYQRTDVDCSRNTDAIDVVKIVSVAFRGEQASTEYCDPCGP